MSEKSHKNGVHSTSYNYFKFSVFSLNFMAINLDRVFRCVFCRIVLCFREQKGVFFNINKDNTQ